MVCRRIVCRRLLRDVRDCRVESRRPTQEARRSTRTKSNSAGGGRHMGPIELLVGALITAVAGVAAGYAMYSSIVIFLNRDEVIGRRVECQSSKACPNAWFSSRA